MGRKTATKTSATSPQVVAITIRRGLALSLRMQGGNYAAIAEAMRTQPGVPARYGQALAYKDVTDELNRLNKENAEAADQIRRLEFERSEALLAAAWQYASQGDMASIDRVLRIMDFQARLYDLYPKEVKEPRGAGGGSAGSLTDNATTLTISEVVIELRGVESQPPMIDVTPEPSSPAE